jgi:hypothetical protein
LRRDDDLRATRVAEDDHGRVAAQKGKVGREWGCGHRPVRPFVPLAAGEGHGGDREEGGDCG